MPSLAERREDIPLLTAHFLGKYRQVRPPSQPPVQGITPESQYLLASYAWPGNVRELEHAILRAITLGKSPFIGREDLPDDIAGAAKPPNLGRWETEVAAAKKKILERAMKETGGNRAEAAKLLNLHPTYFASLCKQFDVKWPL
ncbi:MAG TPA: helix-turn-helix domain-containing protein [Terriglobia bacterium]|jgi:DNA-binding NtrC family response regulator